MKKGFTMLEMILVLMVISVLLLITVPNIAQKRKLINSIGCKALIEVVNSQILAYQLEHGSVDNIEQLVKEGYINESQTICPDGCRLKIVNGEAVLE